MSLVYFSTVNSDLTLSILHASLIERLLIIFLFCVIVYKKEPPVPPSKAQAVIAEASKDEDYFSSLRRLFKNRGFLLLMVTYGK